MTSLVDSSVIIAAFRQNETCHKQALNILQAAEKIIILDLVLSEILTVIKMREGLEVAKKVADFLTCNEDVMIEKLDDDGYEETLNFFKNNKNKLSFVDTALLIFGKVKKITLTTFDKDLGKLNRNFSKPKGLQKR